MWAADRGVRQLVAGIQAHNRPALLFCRCRGYRDNGMVRTGNGTFAIIAAKGRR